MRRRSPQLALGGCGTALQTMFDPVVLKVERSTEYYDVRGATSDEILEYLDAHSLTDAQGRRLAGSTKSSWRLQWSAYPQSTSCYLQRLTVGKSWDMKFQETRPGDRQTEEIQRRCTAEGEERVTVPAGTFSTFRVVCQNVRTNSGS